MPEDSFDQLSKFFRAYRKSHAIFTAYELGVFDRISKSPVEINVMVKELGLSKKGLTRLLSVLCALGIIEKESSVYTLSADYESLLNPNSPNHIGGLIDHEIHLNKRWGKLSESVKSGEPVKKVEVQTNSKDTQRFITAMAAIGQRSAPILLEHVGLRGTEHLLDLGGGPGIYAEKFLDEYPDLQITLFDQPETIKVAQSVLSNHTSFRNIEFISGNFQNDPIGENYDIIFSSNVIHIFGSESLKSLFDKCHQALKPGGRLLIKDFFLNDDYTGPEFTSLFSLHMLMSTEDGKCYSDSEMISLLEESNFSHSRSIKITENSKVIEGIK
jgi:ubiquinone/menaquinone biosynthesis C-methylase UbiE